MGAKQSSEDEGRLDPEQVSRSKDGGALGEDLDGDDEDKDLDTEQETKQKEEKKRRLAD